jgi:pimeloyl-ACP methyl ester carboxylesterase
MSDDRIHRAVSADGTEIAGRVHGHGPPLVLVHGGPHDGDLAWEALVPHLADHYTCYLPSVRGRGLSADSPDLSPPRLEEDFTAFVDSIGEPVGLVGWSSGGPWVLGAAAHSASVAAVALYEPAAFSVLRGDDHARMSAAFAEGNAAAADGRFVDASRANHAGVLTDGEIAALDTDYFERCAVIIPAGMKIDEQGGSYDGPQPTDPELLAEVSVPVLLLRGQETLLATFFADSEQHIAEHVADAHVREPLPGVGHFAPLVAPEPVARELISFFESVRQSRVEIELTEEFGHPIAEVFRFYATEHVKNHPRWDPDIELWLDEDAPIGVGTVIRRRNSRSGSPVDGTMKVTEYEPNRSFAMVIHDGPMEMRAKATFDDLGGGYTRLNLIVDLPIEESMREHMTGLMLGSLARIKKLLDEDGQP